MYMYHVCVVSAHGIYYIEVKRIVEEANKEKMVKTGLLYTRTSETTTFN